MKKVRYAVGATAALAPAALGAAVTTTAHATAAPEASSAKAKTVSLNHAAAAATCTGVFNDQIAVNSLIQEFSVWNYSRPGSVCIGTMEVRRHFKNNNCINVGFHVFIGKDEPPISRSLRNRCGTAGSTKTIASGIRVWVPVLNGTSYVSACTTSTYTQLTCQHIYSH